LEDAPSYDFGVRASWAYIGQLYVF